MKSLHTSYIKNKEDLKIVFEKFPGDTQKEDKTIEKNKKKNKKKNSIFKILIIIVLISLFIGSSILNKIVLSEIESKSYKVVNKFKGNYANIKKEDRTKLFKEIGFDVSKEKIEIKDDTSYITTYAFRKLSIDNDLADSISVYYDINNNVTYIVLTLIYEKDEFGIFEVAADCNAIIKNFVDINTSRNMINQAMENNYYYSKDKDTKITSFYSLTDNNGYYVLSLVVN